MEQTPQKYKTRYKHPKLQSFEVPTCLGANRKKSINIQGNMSSPKPSHPIAAGHEKCNIAEAQDKTL